MAVVQATLPAGGQEGLRAKVAPPINSFRHPKDFETACSKEGAEFTILAKGAQGGSQAYAQSTSKCLIKIRLLEREPIEAEARDGVVKVGIVSANMWVGGEPACRMDRALKYYSDGRVVGDMMEATPGLDRSDPQICEMDRKSRHDSDGNLVLNGFWSNPKISFHKREGGTIKRMGRSLLSIIDLYCMGQGMESFRMCTPTTHEREIIMSFYLSRHAAVMYADKANPKDPFAIRIEFKPDTEKSLPLVYDEGKPWLGLPPKE